ncbi:MAG: FAD-binding protein [Proteobacteria bacterium]|nr:FAD-binding protein [Pseudomonadota bacterium]
MDKNTIKKLGKILGSEHLTTEKEDLICYSYDATGEAALPEAVAFPGSASEIAEIMHLASKEEFPVIPRGAGSGFVGGSVPIRGGLVLSTKRLNRIIEIDMENMVAVVEPGVITGHIQSEVEKMGLFYPPDPSSLKFCTIGGNVAMGSGGPRAVKYGVTRDYVLGLEVILPTGEVISTGTRTAKGVVGYDMTRLLIGSEGTLGIVTKITLRLIPKPEKKATLYAEFPDTKSASEAVSGIMASGTVPATLEFIDKSALACIKKDLSIPLKQGVGAILIIEADGSRAAVSEDAARLKGLCKRFGAGNIVESSGRKEAEKLWDTRRAISPSLFRLGTKKINEDIVVPRNCIPKLIERLEAISKKYNLTIANFGHAGDGNIHVNIMLNKGNVDEEKRAEAATKEVFQTALDLNGTISGEHGIGLSKQPYLGMELSDKEIDLMRGVKKVFDPKNILNPGKIFPQE